MRIDVLSIVTGRFGDEVVRILSEVAHKPTY
jgi:hypothetical protein